MGQSSGATAANPDAQGGHDGPPPLPPPDGGPRTGQLGSPSLHLRAQGRDLASQPLQLGMLVGGEAR
ncbi:MAG TPA: hypothetical protein VK736_06065, partial [Candidatus Binatia bacterium]|nr:hypothetical protein [Candidatus Binatia bacterium]